jgi:hypothetical protein
VGPVGNAERPSFVTRKGEGGAESPEALFTQSTRAKTHGYLRGPQQDVLRGYLDYVDAANVALELPSGTGKTAVGLLIADWRRRRTAEKAAYLALTNQLAHQVIEEGARLGIPCADLTGDKFHRSRNEEGRYLEASAVGVTTYSNLFNINPVIQPSDILVLDDAHGGEQYVAGMWTVDIAEAEDPNLFEECLVAIRPLLTDLEYRRLNDPFAFSVQLCDLLGDGACSENLTAALDHSGSDRVRFSWRLIRNNLSGCVILVSAKRIVIRPIIAPTDTHEGFAQARQRLLMSATLGDPGDLMREYGLDTIETLKAEKPQWGHRYIFVPEMHTTEGLAAQILAGVWNRLEPQRAVLLTPSSAVLERVFDTLCEGMDDAPSRISASDIADSLEVFTRSDGAMLTVAGRYDGLDFPDDDCRLLIMAEAPSAISDLERHLRDYWKLGPLMRRRELTRLVQGLGRCTRNSTDYSVVFWLGQSLVNAAANPALVRGLPKEVCSELRWGIAQSKLAGQNPESLATMAWSLLDDESYRQQANESISDYELEGGQEPPPLGLETVLKEVRFSRAMWSQDFNEAHSLAREIADGAGDSGYRAWWWYQASTAAGFIPDEAAESDCLRRAIHCGINSGWIRGVAQRRGRGRPQAPDECSNSEGVWSYIEKVGWAGPKFRQEMDGMIGLVGQTEHKQFHEGLERLGRCLGAQPTRSTEQGAPDVVWSFEDGIHVVFEAKSEKSPDGFISKGDVLQAKGHVEWLKARLEGDRESARIVPVIVSPTSKLHDAARPHTANLYWVHPDEVSELAVTTAEVLSELRAACAGKDLGQVKDALSARLKLSKLHLDGVIELLTKKPLQSP